MIISLHIPNEQMKDALSGKPIRVEFDTVKKYACGESIEIIIEAEQ